MTIDQLFVVNPSHSMTVNHRSSLTCPRVQVVSSSPQVNYVALINIPSIANEKATLFSCSSSLHSNLTVEMVTTSLGELEPDPPPISLSEFLDMYSF